MRICGCSCAHAFKMTDTLDLFEGFSKDVLQKTPYNFRTEWPISVGVNS